MPKIPAKDVAKAIRKHNGNITAAAEDLRVTRQGLYYRIRNNPKLNKILEESREVQLDRAEAALKKAVDNGQGWAICFTLKTIGRLRGYIEYQRISMEDLVEAFFALVPSENRPQFRELLERSLAKDDEGGSRSKDDSPKKLQ